MAARLSVMAGGFDVSRAVGAGIGDRWRAREFVAEFAAAWTRPLAPGDGCSEDVLLPPDRLRMDHAAQVIVFRSENQRCAEWGVAATGWNAEDPPVYVRRLPGGRPWEPFLGRMSLACAEMVLTEVLLGSKFLDMCDLPGELIGAAESAYRQVALPEYPLWAEPAVTIRWFAGPGKLLRMDGRGPYCWLSAAGQTRTDLESIYKTIPGPWATG